MARESVEAYLGAGSRAKDEARYRAMQREAEAQRAAAIEAERAARAAAQNGGTTGGGLTKQQQSAYDLLVDLFKSYGLPTNSDVLDVIKESAINGDSPEVTQVALQQTESWKQRFKGNELRRQNGLNVLSVAEYLAMENQYATIMRNAGVPTGFYDDPNDFADFIGKSISPAEVQERVTIAADLVNQEDDAVKAELAKRGISQGQLIAYALDPDRAAPLIRRDLNSIAIGSVAARAGINLDTGISDNLASRGVDAAGASTGFAQVSQIAGATQKLGDIYGVDYGTADAISEVFDNNESAAQRRRNLAARERSNFTGQAQYGVNRQSRAGQF